MPLIDQNCTFLYNRFCTFLDYHLYIWESARKFIEENEDRESLSQGIITLKRSYETRQKLIFRNYPFEIINFNEKTSKKKKVELLAQYGLVRPYFISKLLRVRNLIEHEDEHPPEKDDCQELLDSVWYFLKSTDELILHIPKLVAFTRDEASVYVDFNMEEFLEPNADVFFHFKAYIDTNLLSFEKTSNSFCLKNLNIVSKKKVLEKILFPYEKEHLHFRYKYLFIEGILYDDNDQFKILKKVVSVK